MITNGDLTKGRNGCKPTNFQIITYNNTQKVYCNKCYDGEIIYDKQNGIYRCTTKSCPNYWTGIKIREE